MSRRAGAEVGIDRILCAALKTPERLSSVAVADVEIALGAASSEARRMLALGALAAILYTRPDLIGRSTVRALDRMVSSPGSPELTEAAARTLSLFAGPRRRRPRRRHSPRASSDDGCRNSAGAPC